ncbi:MAG: wax ester/triacylglycerol synthase family O-acyltransferase [Gammaproteobacteria bacterium]|nr:wax ester/triacylglycerol synthase family O-acyltransferase [Gammaproteobacteria bacterium]
MTPLSPADQLFLWLEKRQQPMHVGALVLFSYPEGAGPKYVTELAESLRAFQSPERPFNQKLVNRFGQYFWEEDDHFDLEHHFRHEALPKPGRIRELLALVSAEHSNLMDRERPMWEFHLIEGLQGRRFAVYSKAHHCMMDGIAAMRTTLRTFSTDPTETGRPPVWAMPPRKRPEGLPSATEMVSGLSKFADGAGKQLATLPVIAREMAKSIRKSRSQKSDYVSIFQAPHSILNEPITGSRRFAAQSWPSERFKKVAKAFHCTMNDIVLAVCGSALRDYLISQHALPDKPLIAMVPMSIRRDDSDSGNQIAMILANLGTHVADPATRIEIIKASIKDAKDRFKGMSPEQMLNYTALMMAPAGFNMLTGLLPQWAPFNVVISNVPGPKKTLFWNGAKMEGMYPVSIPIDRIALNITLLSYVDHLEFGLTACRRTLPSMQKLLTYIENGIRELEIAADL